MGIRRKKPTTHRPSPAGAQKPRSGASPPPTSQELAWRESRTALEGVRLLVVEDDRDSRDMLVMVFEQCGGIVSAVGSAEEAMEALQRATPDVLVSDIGLPGEDGHELMRKVRALEAEKGGRIPALALTAYAGRHARGSALAAGFDLQVSKPVDLADLVAQAVLLAGLRGRS